MDCREGDRAYCYSAAILRYCYWLSSHGAHKEQTWTAVNQPRTGGFAVRWRAFDIASRSWLTSHCKNGMHAAAGSSICQEWDAGSVLFQQPAPGPRWHLMALPTLQIVCVCVSSFCYMLFFSSWHLTLHFVLWNFWCGVKRKTHTLHFLERGSPPEQKSLRANRWLAKPDNPIHYRAQWAERNSLISQDVFYL